MPVPSVRTHGLLLMAPEPDSADTTERLDTLRAGTPSQFTADAVGGGGSTITAGALDNASVRAYVGNLLEVVSGAARGQWRMISDFNGATIATVTPAFSPAPAAGDSLRLWVPPDPVVVATAGTTTSVTAVIVTTAGRPGRDEANGFWNGNLSANGDRFMLIGVGGQNANRAALITDWTSPTFTVEANAFVAADDGDLFLIRKLARIYDFEFPLPGASQPYLHRRFVAGDWDGRDGELGPRNAETFAFAQEVQRVAAAASGATDVEPPSEVHDLLAGLWSYTGTAASAVTAGSSTSAINITTGTRERFNHGTAILDGDSGAMAWIIGSTDGGVGDDILTVTPTLPSAPTAAETVFGSANYAYPTTPSTFGFRSNSFDVWMGNRGGLRHCHGYLPAWRIEGMDAEGGLLRFAFEGPYDFHWTDSRTIPTWTTARGGRLTGPATGITPMVARAVRAHLAEPSGSAATTFASIRLRGIALGSGLSPQVRKGMNGPGNREGVYMDADEKGVVGSIMLDMEDVVQLERFERGVVMEFSAQFGESRSGAAFGIWIRRLRFTASPISIDGSLYRQELQFVCIDSGITGLDTDGATTISIPQCVMSFA